MKHLFFVAVALGIFSGTSFTAKAQLAVNTIRIDDGMPLKKSVLSIEGLEIKSTPAKRSVIERKGGIENCSSIQFKYAQLLNTEVESIQNFELFNFVEEWWATRYRYGGKTKAGIDCSSYAGTLLNTVFGLTAPRTARDQYSVCDKIDKENLQEGDLVFFNTRGGVSHVGVYLNNGFFTHASVGNGVTISHLNENYYSKKFIGGGRISNNLPAE